METLLVELNTKKEKKVLLAFLDSLNYKYNGPVNTDDQDTTSYLLSGKAMKKHLEKNIEEANSGKTKSIELENLWK